MSQSYPIRIDLPDSDETKIVNTINMYYYHICSHYYNEDAINFFKQQIDILKNRLEKIQDYDDYDDYDETRYYTNGHDTQHYHKNDYFSLQSWFQKHFSMNTIEASKYSNEHCNQIETLYKNKYGSSPIKICQEFVQNGIELNKVYVNSYNKIHYEDIIRSYLANLNLF